MLFFVSLSVFSPGSNTWAQDKAALAQEAQAAYEAANYPQAFELWQQLAVLGENNADLYLNMALAAWQQGLQAQSLRYFLKAKQIIPRDAQLRHNLAIVTEVLGQDADAQNIPGLKLPWWRLSLSQGEALMFFALATLLLFSYLIARFFNKAQSKGLMISLALLWLFSLGIWGSMAWQNRLTRAVVITTEAPLLEAPTHQAPLGRNLFAGQILKILRVQGDFRLVKTPQGEEVWLASKNLGEI